MTLSNRVLDENICESAHRGRFNIAIIILQLIELHRAAARSSSRKSIPITTQQYMTTAVSLHARSSRDHVRVRQTKGSLIHIETPFSHFLVAKIT